MRLRLSHIVAVVLAVACVGALRAPVQRRPAARPGADRSWRDDPRWAADAAVNIEWGADWDTTYASNRQKWLNELANDRLRDARMNVRLIVLQEALIAKYPELVERHAEAYRDMANRLRSMNFYRAANEYCRRSVEAAPGRVDLAILSLTTLVRGGDTVSAEMMEYAARRVLALHRAGALPEADPLVADAWRALARALRIQGLFMEAAEALENYQRWGVDATAASIEEANLYDECGHVDEAILRLQSLAAEHEDRALRERVNRLSEGQVLSPGRFAGDESIAVRWSIMRLRPPKDLAADVLPLLEEDPHGRNIVPWDGMRFTSLWAALDRLVRGMPGEMVRPLREAQELRAGAAMQTPQQKNVADLLALYRRYPWSRSALAGLLEAGEQLLRHGHKALARRCFQDVIDHAADADLRRRAENGAKLSSVAPDALPADSAQQPAATVKVEAIRLPPNGCWPDELLRRIPEEFMPALRWTGPSLHMADGRLLAVSPNLLVCFAGWPPRPLWQQMSPIANGAQGRLGRDVASQFAMPGPCRAACGGGMVYHRWGLDASGEFTTAVAAFDAATGRLVWSTADAAGLAGLWPVADPTYFEGRVYYPAIAQRTGSTASAAVSVVCVDAADGSPVFVRGIADLSLSLPIHSEERRRRKGEEFPRADVARYGNAVTAIDGEIYCITNMGVAARLDARDGVVEWAITYPRAMLRRDSLPVLRRHGAAPVVAGRLVIFAPRDRYGLLAVDRQTGQVVWDGPFIYSRDVAGLAGQTLVVCDEHRLAGIDSQSGATVWLRDFASPIEGVPQLSGNIVHVNLGARLLAIDGRSGAVLGEQTWPGSEPVREFAIAGSGAVTLTERSAGAETIGAASVSPPRGSAETAGRWLEPRWHVPAVNPRLLRPPQQSPLRDLAYAVGADGLVCVDPSARSPVLWRRWAAPGIERIEFVGDAVLLLYADRASRIDGRTGELRWHVRLPMVSDEAAAAEDLLIVAAAGEHSPLEVAAIDMATGALAWHRRGTGSSPLERLVGIAAIVMDGDNVHVAGLSAVNGPLAQIILRRADGAIAGGGRLSDARSLQKVVFDGMHGCAITDKGAVEWFALSAGGTEDDEHRAGNLPAGTVPEGTTVTAFTMRGPWTLVQTFRSYPPQRTTCVYRRGDGQYRLSRPGAGEIIGDRLYECSGRTLTVVDLPSRREVQCVVPVMESLDHHTDILNFWQDGGELVVISGLERGFSTATRTPADLRIDVFDATTGMHRRGQVLLAGGYWKAWYETPSRSMEVVHRTQAMRAGRAIVATAADGLHAWTPMPAGASNFDPLRARQAMLCRRVSTGSTPDDWPMDGAPDRAAVLRAWHDGETLYLEASYRDERIDSWRGEPFRSGGDWLEVGLTTNVDSWRFGAGVSDDGRTVLRPVAGGRIPPACRAGVWHDLQSGRHIYRLQIPLKRAVYRDETAGWRDIGLSVALWDSAPSGPPARIAVFGDALRRGHLEVAGHQRVHLCDLSAEGEQAASAIADALPVLEQSLKWVEDAARARAAWPGAVVDFYRGYLSRHPAGPQTDRALLALDAYLRQRVADPVGTVLKVAGEAKVSAAAQKRYAAVAGAYISQWVLVDGVRMPRMLLMQFSDGRTWEHRVSWGQFQAIWTGFPDTPSRRIVGTMPAPGTWQELRIPLVWIDLHDKPICGVSFGQLGGARTYWDRTALVIDGREKVFIEDDLPAGKAGGFWDWVEEPRKSGSRSHTYAEPASADDPAWHDIGAMQSPVRDHLLPPSGQVEMPGVAKTMEILRKHLPALGPTDTAMDFFRAMVGLQDSPQHRMDCYRWFMGAMPGHPRLVEVIAAAYELLRASGAKDAAEQIDAMLAELKVPPRACYTFRRTCVHAEHAFLTEWQVLGPFSNADDSGFDYPYPPETQRIRLDTDYRGITGAIRWKQYRSTRDFVDLAAAFSPNENTVAYAVCWVRSEKGRPVTIEFGSDDGAKVWINRRLVHAVHEHDYAQRGDYRIAAYLAPGWNEILVKVEQTTGDWGFFMELVDPQGRGPLTDVTVSATPPG